MGHTMDDMEMSLRQSVVSPTSAKGFRQALSSAMESAHCLSQNTLDSCFSHFILYSSVSSIIGQQGCSTLAAASAFMNELAQCRRTHGLPAVSVLWPHVDGQSAPESSISE